MRLVVTGAGGGLARAFLAGLAGEADVVALAHADLDVGDATQVRERIPACDAIVNLAAFTDVDGCERDPVRAERDNATAVGHLAAAAREREPHRIGSVARSFAGIVLSRPPVRGRSSRSRRTERAERRSRFRKSGRSRIGARDT